MTFTQNCIFYFIPSPHGVTARSGPGHPQCWGFAIRLRHTTVGRTPLDGWSAWRRNLYLTTHNTLYIDIHTPTGFDPATPAS
jgi:hypothetical protein